MIKNNDFPVGGDSDIMTQNIFQKLKLIHHYIYFLIIYKQTQ